VIEGGDGGGEGGVERARGLVKGLKGKVGGDGDI